MKMDEITLEQIPPADDKSAPKLLLAEMPNSENVIGEGIEVPPT